MFSTRVVVCSLGLAVVAACAEAQEEPADSNGHPSSGKSGSSQGGMAGTSAVSEGGSLGGAHAGASAGGNSNGTGGKAGAASGGAAHAGTSNGGGAGTSGSTTGGKGGGGGGGGVGGSGGAGGGVGGTSAGGGAAGTSAAGSGSGLGCSVEASAGAGGDTGSGGADGNPSAFFDDFETGAASKWTTTLGIWTIVDDGSKAFDQSIQENKLQIAIANGQCSVDQIIDAHVKVIGFKGQSSSYVAAVFGRVVSPTTHYLLALGSDGKLALRKRVNSTSTGATAIGTALALTVTEGDWYDVHFEIIGTSLKGCVGAVCVTGTDSSITSGGVAVGTVNTAARFDDVRVTLP